VGFCLFCFSSCEKEANYSESLNDQFISTRTDDPGNPPQSESVCNCKYQIVSVDLNTANWEGYSLGFFENEGLCPGTVSTCGYFSGAYSTDPNCINMSGVGCPFEVYSTLPSSNWYDFECDVPGNSIMNIGADGQVFDNCISGGDFITGTVSFRLWCYTAPDLPTGSCGAYSHISDIYTVEIPVNQGIGFNEISIDCECVTKD